MPRMGINAGIVVASLEGWSAREESRDRADTKPTRNYSASRPSERINSNGGYLVKL